MIAIQDIHNCRKHIYEMLVQTMIHADDVSKQQNRYTILSFLASSDYKERGHKMAGLIKKNSVLFFLHLQLFNHNKNYYHILHLIYLILCSDITSRILYQWKIHSMLKRYRSSKHNSRKKIWRIVPSADTSKYISSPNVLSIFCMCILFI